MKNLIAIILFLIIAVGCETNLEVTMEENPYITLRRIQTREGVDLDFFLVLPEVMDSNRIYPVLLALPSGEQTRELVENGLENYWAPASIRRNWIVVSPIAPDEFGFYGGGEALIDDLFNWVESRYNVEGGKFHVAGASAGGISSFRIAIEYTDRCMSIMPMPGYPIAGDFENLDLLREIPVAMFVGAADEPFIIEMERTYQRLDSLGAEVTYTVLPTDGHVIRSVAPDGWFNVLDRFRPE